MPCAHSDGKQSFIRSDGEGKFACTCCGKIYTNLKTALAENVGIDVTEQPAGPDTREVVAALLAGVNPPEWATRLAGVVINELRRRGAWLPGDPVTEGMVFAYDHEISKRCRNKYDWEDIRAALTMALNSRIP